MKRLSFLSLLCSVSFLMFQTTPAQFPKIPKLPKVSSKPADPVQQPAATTETRSTEAKPVSTSSRRSGGPYAVKPAAPETPLFLAETLEVGIEHWDYYWKIPNDNHNTSWAVPGSISMSFTAGPQNSGLRPSILCPTERSGSAKPWIIAE